MCALQARVKVVVRSEKDLPRLCDKLQFAGKMECAISRLFVPWDAGWSTTYSMVLEQATKEQSRSRAQ